jgi:hypothetical protein
MVPKAKIPAVLAGQPPPKQGAVLAMANVQSAFGFRHIGFLSGAGPDYQLATRSIQSSNATKIFYGDPIIKSGAYIVQCSTANNTTVLEGIFQGCMYTPSGGIPTWSPFWPGAAAVDATAYIINAPNAIFLAAALNTAISTAAIGEGISFSLGTGSTVGGGFSGATIDQSTLSTSSAAPFQIISLYPGVGNGSDSTTAYNWAVVTFNNQRFKNNTTVA